jgi:gamma-glutamyl-gamma-aminobutyrate hydrolase PuuD
MLAVQWHPEEMHADARAPERGLFKALVERAGASAAASVDS